MYGRAEDMDQVSECGWVKVVWTWYGQVGTIQSEGKGCLYSICTLLSRIRLLEGLGIGRYFMVRLGEFVCM